MVRVRGALHFPVHPQGSTGHVLPAAVDVHGRNRHGPHIYEATLAREASLGYIKYTCRRQNARRGVNGRARCGQAERDNARVFAAQIVGIAHACSKVAGVRELCTIYAQQAIVAACT